MRNCLAAFLAAALIPFSTTAMAETPSAPGNRVQMSDAELDKVSAGSVILILFNPGNASGQHSNKNGSLMLINQPPGAVEGTAGVIFVSNPAKSLVPHCISIRSCL